MDCAQLDRFRDLAKSLTLDRRIEVQMTAWTSFVVVHHHGVDLLEQMPHT